MFGIPPLSFASKSYPSATSEAPIESQTPTECTEIPFSQNELVAPKKKPNQKIAKEKKCRGAFLRSSQVRKLLFEKPSHRVTSSAEADYYSLSICNRRFMLYELLF